MAAAQDSPHRALCVGARGFHETSSRRPRGRHNDSVATGMQPNTETDFSKTTRNTASRRWLRRGAVALCLLLTLGAGVAVASVLQEDQNSAFDGY